MDLQKENVYNGIVKRNQKGNRKMKTAKGFITKFLTGILAFAILAVTAFLITFFAVRFKGFKVDPIEPTKQTNELCIYECEEGKASIDSEIARLIGYRDEGIENYFPDMTHEEVAEYVEQNLHTLIAKLKEDGYTDEAIRKGQTIYIYYYLGQIGWDYSTLYTREIDQVQKIVDKDGDFLFAEGQWQKVYANYGKR